MELGGDELKTRTLKLTNCWVLQNGAFRRDHLWIRNGLVHNMEKDFWAKRPRLPDEELVLDCQGLYLSPGFIDIQINGAFGVDFADPDKFSEEGLRTVARGLIQHGVTAFVPTVITSSPRAYYHILPIIRKVMEDLRPDEAQVLGCHLEGPFISKSKYGAHPKALLQSTAAKLSDMEICYGPKFYEFTKIVTLASELPGALDAIKELTANGVVCSIGHSMATLREAEMALESGASMVTHLFNAMVPFHHRDPGIVGLLGVAPVRPDLKLYYGIIADGVHTHPASVRIAYSSHKSGAIIVTDAMQAMGITARGTVHLGESKVNISEGVARVEGTGELAGSVARMDECLKHFKIYTGCTLAESCDAASTHPAKALNLKNKGKLAPGYDADVIILDLKGNVKGVICRGRVLWHEKGVLVPL